VLKLRRSEATLTLMVLLTFVTGVVDAVGYLGLDRVFTGNMTGNIVILGMGLAGADELPILGPVVALAAFALGAFSTGMFLRRSPKGWTSRVTAVLVAASVALAGTAVALVFVQARHHHHVGFQVSVAAITAAVMGAQATAARKVAVADMTTVVVTSTLTQLASESFVAGGVGAVLNRRLVAIVAIFLGAVAGALLLHFHIAIPIGLASAISFAVAIIGHRTAVAAAQANLTAR
jgi:uncharacterized membrane protein YoaK (UPF0700 family)